MLIWRSSPAIFLACMMALTARAQGTADDYQRAASLRARTQNKVFKTRIEPHWFAGNAKFWYCNELPDGIREYVVVDAVHGTRQAAFDHLRLGEALAKAGVNAAADRLKFDSLEFPVEGAIEFQTAGKGWRCDLASYELYETQYQQKRRPASLSREVARSSSSRSGAETFLTFVNGTPGVVEIFWLDFRGTRQSYGKLAAGEKRRQHTFGGHVWEAVDSAGRTLGVFEGQESPRDVEISSSYAEPTRPSNRTPWRRRGGGSRNTSPDGRWRASLRDHNLWITDTTSGQQFALSDDGKPGDSYSENVYWSPDSAKLVALRTEKGDERQVYLIESSPADQLQPKLHSFKYLKPGDKIDISKPHVFDVASRAQIHLSDDLFSNPWSVREIRWAADSSRFTFLYNQRGHQVLRVISVDSQSGEARAIIDEQSPTFIDYNSKTFTHYLDETNEIIWMSERDGWNHLYLYDASSGEVKNQITKGSWVVRGVDRVDAEQRQIWFRAGGIEPDQDPYYVHHCRIGFDGTGLVKLTEGDGTHEIEYSPNREFLIDTYSRVDMPAVTELRQVDDGRLVCELEQADWSELLATGWQVPERFVAKGRDGQTDIYGVIYRPSQFDENRKYPVIESIYAGPQGASVPKRFSSYHDAQGLAELGFIVVQIDGMGTNYRSKAFHDVCWKNLADAGLPDRISWIEAAAAKYPYIDTTRVGIYGTSAGGQNALAALLAHPDFYTAAVASCGCHDNRMDKIWWNELWMGWPVGPHYDASSNVTNAHKLRGNLLLIVGELDRNVDPASTMQVAAALIKAGKDFELVVIPGAGHGLGGSYGHRRLQDFFVRHLFNTDPPNRNAPRP
jgi:dipeptidyl aminopeptidase/acylaminoacyl peptidase